MNNVNNMNVNEIKPNSIVRGSIFPEPVQVILITSIGNSVKLIGKGLNSGRVYEPVLSGAQLAKAHYKLSLLRLSEPPRLVRQRGHAPT